MKSLSPPLYWRGGRGVSSEYLITSTDEIKLILYVWLDSTRDKCELLSNICNMSSLLKHNITYVMLYKW